MAFCENCGQELVENAKFCVHCGTPVASAAPESVNAAAAPEPAAAAPGSTPVTENAQTAAAYGSDFAAANNPAAAESTSAGFEESFTRANEQQGTYTAGTQSTYGGPSADASAPNANAGSYAANQQNTFNGGTQGTYTANQQNTFNGGAQGSYQQNAGFGGAYQQQAATPEEQDIQQNKGISVLSYLGILFLIPLLSRKDSKFAQFHANQGILLFGINVIIFILNRIVNYVQARILWYYSSGLLTILNIIEVILGIVTIGGFVLAIIGIVNAASGKKKGLPLIGSIQLLKDA